MKFEFKNLGPIKSGCVEIGDLTVICGRNNVGKTYVSHSIWGLLNQNDKGVVCAIDRDVREEKNFPDDEGSYSYEISLANIVFYFSNKSLLESFGKKGLASNFNVDAEMFSNTEIDFYYSEDLKNDVEKVVLGEGQLGIRLLDMLKRISFKTNFNSLAGISTEVLKKSGDSFFRFDYSIDDDYSKRDFPDINPANLLDFIIRDWVSSVIFSNVSIITSERTGIALFFPELDKKASELASNTKNVSSGKISISDAFKAWQEKKNYYPTYAAPIQDNIDRIRAVNRHKGESDICENQLILSVLHDLVGGEFELSLDGVSYSINGTTIPLHMVSSSAKSLFLIEHYIKREAKVGDLLIIDEPELNLHLDNQVKMAHLIAALVNAGIKVMITTHSDHLLRELNNLIMLSSPKIEHEDLVDLSEEYSFDKGLFLKPDQVKAAVVSASEKNIYSMPVSDIGIEMDLFNKEINSNNNRARDIYLAVTEG